MLPYYHDIVLPYHHTTILVYYRTTIPLYYRTILPYYRTTITIATTILKCTFYLVGLFDVRHSISVSLQIHWNNPEQESNYSDASGMTLFYTQKLRPNRGEIFMVAQNYLEIPPGVSALTQSGVCPAACTRALPRSVALAEIGLHMHTLGEAMG